LITAHFFVRVQLANKQTLNILRGDFLQSRVKRSKLSDQAFAKKCCAAILVLKVSRQTELLYGIFGYVIGQNIAKYKEG
jgi:hypothetical protein